MKILYFFALIFNPNSASPASKSTPYLVSAPVRFVRRIAPAVKPTAAAADAESDNPFISAASNALEKTSPVP